MSAPLALLHGFLGAPAAWDAVLAALPGSVRGAAAVRPPLPGHGLGAAVPPDSWDGTVDAVADRLPAGAVVLAGYSNGGRLALGILARHPARVAALVLVSAHLGIDEPGSRAARALEDDRLAQLAEDEGIEALVEAHAARPVMASQASLDVGALATLTARRRAHDPRAVARMLRASGLGAMPDLRPALREAALRGVPVVTLAGELDFTYAALAREAAELGAGRSRIARGCGHDLLLEAPGAVAGVLGDLLAAGARPAAEPLRQRAR